MEVVQPRPLRRSDHLPVVGADVADSVPAYSRLRVVAIRRDLHCGARAVLVVPAQAAKELLVQPVAEQLQLVLLDGVNAKLRLFSRADALWPGVAEQPIREQAKVMRDVLRHSQGDTLGTEFRVMQGDAIWLGREVTVDGAARP